MEERNAIISIVGRPNVGKSTLTNAMTGEKVSIISNKPQTTRSRITGIVCREGTQFILMDTPGFHRARNRLGEFMTKQVRTSISGADAAVLVVEPIPEVGKQEKVLIEHIKSCKIKTVLAINKIDLVEKGVILSTIAAYSSYHDFEAIIPISAKSGDGIDSLFAVLDNFSNAGSHLFPDEMYTDQAEKYICAEIIREKLLWCLDKEVPHGAAVEVTKFSEREDGIIDIDATIYCEKSSHKGIILGKNGQMLKKISSLAREDIEDFLQAHIYLQTWVKVKENWRDSSYLLNNFGFSNK